MDRRFWGRQIMAIKFLLSLLLLALMGACSAPSPTEGKTGEKFEPATESAIFEERPQAKTDTKVQLTLVAEGLQSPLFVTAAKGDDKLFIVEQVGRIIILQKGQQRVGLDIRERVTHKGEAGLLGLALHPDFLQNGLAFVSYTSGDLTSVIEAFIYDKNTGQFDPESGRVIYTLDQPAGNHNGGMVAFGPDGYLYAGFGDGGGGNDSYRNGQNFDTALGTLIRIEVDPTNISTFQIPADNPNPMGPAPEAWIYGMRNPWRFSFDGDLLYIGDVGQSAWEEIDVIKAGAASSGANLGWPLAEGDACHQDEDCRNGDLVFPVLTYPTRSGCSITGGYVYRGTKIPELQGHYFYGDFCSGRIFSFVYAEGAVSEQQAWEDRIGRVDLISSFGLDGDGELYIVSIKGKIFRLDLAD